MKYLLLCVLWILWCFLHSFFASTEITRWFKNHLGEKSAFYGIFYNLFSLLTVLPLFYWQRAINGPIVIQLSPFLLTFKYITLILSLIVITWSFFSFDIKEFLGIKQIISRGQKNQKPVISKHGFYRIVRHPMYLGGFVFFMALTAGAPLGQFLGYLILAIYMVIGTIREDRRLANELGEAYRQYQREVPMLIPRFFRRGRNK